MGSRIRENVKHFFECFLEVVPKTQDKEAWIIQQYPDTYKDEEVLKSVPKFAYPCHFENATVQHYSFVLTDIESKWTFGFCRHDPKTETAIVVLSYLPWHQAFYKFLNNIAVLLHSPRSEDLRDFLFAVYSRRVPEPGSVFVVPFNKGESTFTCECPNRYKLPSIPENRNLTEYYNAVDATNMIIIFASLLHERRVLVTSRRLSRLAACVQAANDLLYPMVWQHIYIPVLPQTLVDYLLAPMPFLIGVPFQVLQTVNRTDIGDVVVLDADANRVQSPFDDVANLPSEIVSALKRQLRNRATLLGDGVSRAFLRALVHLIGGYRDALRFQQGAAITFSDDAFLASRPPSMQPCLRRVLHLQIFRQFVDERLQMLNKGEGFTDEFEMEVHHFSEKSSSKLKQQYKEWAAHMKKEGSAFFKSVKDKANPAVKTAVKSVKDSGKGMKSAYKGLKSKFRESQGPEYLEQGIRVYVNNSSAEGGADKPRSAPSSPTTRHSYRRERSYSPLTPTETSQTVTMDSAADISTMDLLTEIKDILQHHPPTTINPMDQLPPVDRSLKPVRSLENFNNNTSNAIRCAPSPAPTLAAPSYDLFGSAPFVVTEGRTDNGDALFFVAATDNTFDMVRLSPPVKSPRRKKETKSEDLIRLDSTSSDLEDFDPLLMKDKQSTESSPDSLSSPSPVFATGLSNPLYPYYVPSNSGNSTNNVMSFPTTEKLSNDHDLLQEYGLDFHSISAKLDTGSNHLTFPNSVKPVKPQNQWTKFE